MAVHNEQHVNGAFLLLPGVNKSATAISASRFSHFMFFFSPVCSRPRLYLVGKATMLSRFRWILRGFQVKAGQAEV